LICKTHDITKQSDINAGRIDDWAAPNICSALLLSQRGGVSKAKVFCIAAEIATSNPLANHNLSHRCVAYAQTLCLRGQHRGAKCDETSNNGTVGVLSQKSLRSSMTSSYLGEVVNMAKLPTTKLKVGRPVRNLKLLRQLNILTGSLKMGSSSELLQSYRWL